MTDTNYLEWKKKKKEQQGMRNDDQMICGKFIKDWNTRRSDWDNSFMKIKILTGRPNLANSATLAFCWPGNPI